MIVNGFKDWFRDWIPPALRRIIRKLSAVGYFTSYETALRAAPGYQSEELARVVVAKGVQFKDKLNLDKTLDLDSLRTFIGISAALGKKSLIVIDFGGAAGTHYFIAKSLLGDKIKLDWRVVETEAMVAEAKRCKLEDGSLSFHSDIEESAKGVDVDLIFSSSSLGYTPNPYNILSRLLELRAAYVVITRTAITSQICENYVLLQKSKLSNNGPGPIPHTLNIKDQIIHYPVTILEKEKVETLLTSYGDILLKIIEKKEAYVAKDRSFHFFGYVVKAKPF